MQFPCYSDTAIHGRRAVNGFRRKDLTDWTVYRAINPFTDE